MTGFRISPAHRPFLTALLSALFCICSATKEAGRFFEAGDYRKAGELCVEALRADSTDVDSWILLGRTLAAMDSADRSMAVLQSAWKRNPENRKIAAELASLSMRIAIRAESRKDTAALRSACMETLRWQPFHIPAVEKLAALDEEQGKLTAAAAWNEKLIRQAPDPGPWVSRQNQLESRIRLARDEYEKGKDLQEKQDYLNAESRFEAALQIFREWPECAYALYWTRGMRLYRDGKNKSLKASIESFRKASIAKPGVSDPHYWTGKARERLDPNGFGPILDAYRTFVRLEPEGPRFEEISGRLRELSEKKKKWDAFWGAGLKP